MSNISEADDILQHARPLVHQRGHETQPFGHLAKLPIALDEATCKKSVENLNQLLADTITIRDLYKKHHWQVAGHTFYQLHLLFDKHAEEQTKLVDEIAERIQVLGGVCVAMAYDVAEQNIERCPYKQPLSRGQHAMDEGNRDRTFTHCRCHAFDVAAPHVAHGEDART